MHSTTRPDFTDTRTILWIYAVIAAAIGLLLGTRALPAISTTLVSGPDATRLFFALSGTIVFAAGCVAAGLAQVEDPRGRHRALGWFVAAHVVASGAMLLLGGAEPTSLGFSVLLAPTCLLSYFWQNGDGHRQPPGAGLIDLFGHRRQSAEQLRSAYEERIRAAASQEERHRLARELHDSIKQQIFVMQTAAATAQARMEADPAGAREALDRLRHSGREAMTEMEAMLDSLQSAPLENAGLIELLKKQGEALQLRSGAQVKLEIGSLPPSERLRPGAQQAIFRVAQEALANVGRHARARHVAISMASTEEGVVLRIRDDGIGFQPDAGGSPGMGLTSMRARAHEVGGTLVVESAPGAGASIALTVPSDAASVPDVLFFRNRAMAWGSATLVVLTVLVVLFQDEGERSFFLTLAAINLVIFVHALLDWKRARALAESTPWTKSPSRS